MKPTATPLCAGANPDLFEVPAYYAAALVMCGRCPVRAWCLFTVDPARSNYDGVSGGYIWTNGTALVKNNPGMNRNRDPIIDTYLKACNK